MMIVPLMVSEWKPPFIKIANIPPVRPRKEEQTTCLGQNSTHKNIVILFLKTNNNKARLGTLKTVVQASSSGYLRHMACSWSRQQSQVDLKRVVAQRFQGVKTRANQTSSLKKIRATWICERCPLLAEMMLNSLHALCVPFKARLNCLELLKSSEIALRATNIKKTLKHSR